MVARRRACTSCPIAPAGGICIGSRRAGRCWASREPRRCYPMAAEFGKPQWTLQRDDLRVPERERGIGVTYTEDGRWKMALLETDPRQLRTDRSAGSKRLDGVVATTREAVLHRRIADEAPAIARMPIAAAEAGGASGRPPPIGSRRRGSRRPSRSRFRRTVATCTRSTTRRRIPIRGARRTSVRRCWC